MADCMTHRTVSDDAVSLKGMTCAVHLHLTYIVINVTTKHSGSSRL